MLDKTCIPVYFNSISCHSPPVNVNTLMRCIWDDISETPHTITDHPYSSDQWIPFSSKCSCTRTQEQFCFFSSGHFKTCNRNDGSIVFAFFGEEKCVCVCVWFTGGDFNSKKSHRDVLFIRMVNILPFFLQVHCFLPLISLLYRYQN